jgi:hypothetical protein
MSGLKVRRVGHSFLPSALLPGADLLMRQLWQPAKQ